MKNGFKKFFKGMFGILMIKLVLLGGILIYQACTTEENLNESQAEIDFLAALKSSSENFNFIKVIDKQSLGRSQNEDDLVEVVLINPDPSEDYEITTFSYLVDLVKTESLHVPQENVYCEDDTVQDDSCLIALVNEQEVRDAFEPSVNGARNFLLSRDLTNEDIDIILDGADETTLVPLVQAVLTVEAEADEYALNNNFNTFDFLIGVDNAHAQDWEGIGTCAIAVLGLDSLSTLRDALEGRRVTGRALRKAAKKVIKKFAQGLSGWGTIIMVAEFAMCVAYVHF